jgi:hypothetical protein
MSEETGKKPRPSGRGAVTTEDRSLPVPVSAFEAGLVAGLRRELAQAKETSAVCMRVAATKQAALDEKDRLLVNYCQTIDTQRGLILELMADRDAWQVQALRNEMEQFSRDVKQLCADMKALPRAAAVHEAVWPEFPASALTKGDGIYRGEL